MNSHKSFSMQRLATDVFKSSLRNCLRSTYLSKRTTKMPKRKSANKTKSISHSMLSDITNSEMVPLAASSPTECEISARTNNLNIQELGESAEASRKRLLENVEKVFEERKQELNNLAKELFSKVDLDSTATIDDIKALQKIFNKFKNNNGKGQNNKNVTKSKVEVTLPTVPEQEDDDLGELVEAGNSKEKDNPTKDTLEPPANMKDKSKKKLTFEDEDNSKFKKPRGRPRRSTKNSYQNKNMYQTPKNASRRGYNVAMVTPGPNCDKPISILRRPNPGEMAISMTGSPLLIANDNIPVHVPQISIPLSDGRVITVLANEGLDPDSSICSEIDTETRERLAILQQVLAKKTRNK